MQRLHISAPSAKYAGCSVVSLRPSHPSRNVRRN
jgi:hypothetical protein